MPLLHRQQWLSPVLLLQPPRRNTPHQATNTTNNYCVDAPRASVLRCCLRPWRTLWTATPA